MKSEEKSTNKEKQTLIIRKYHQYLKLEKALSPNTVDAYQTDLQKLLHFLEGEAHFHIMQDKFHMPEVLQ